MSIFATISVTQDSPDMDQFAGRLAQTTSIAMEPTATSHMLMEEVQEKNRNAMVARSGEPFGIQSVRRTSTMLDAVSAHQIAQMV